MRQKSWNVRLEDVYQLMAEMSRQTEPQAMVQAYAARLKELLPVDRRIALSRRGLEFPHFRVTRYSEWQHEVNPWKETHRLPLHSGGLFAELLYSNRPSIIDRLRFAPGDPAANYLDGQQSLMAIPMLDGGEALNMVISTRIVSDGFDRERLPDSLWLANLFGRATHNLVLKEQVRAAYEAVDRELSYVSQIQRSLLPHAMPQIAGLQLSAHYETSQRAGGDYYDFFPLDDGRWGLLIADVSGHGTPAAVVMAITHCIAHLFPVETHRPSALLDFVNGHLTRLYTGTIEAFVTAFYGVYESERRVLTYAIAGHNPPLLWRQQDQRVNLLNGTGGLPLGVDSGVQYGDAQVEFTAGDRFVLYTDGITEATNRNDEMLGVDRLARVMQSSPSSDAGQLLETILEDIQQFTQGQPAADDRTLVIGAVC